MTSVTSLNKNRVLNFFTHTLKKQTPVTLLVTAFCLILCPGLLLSAILERLENYPLIYQNKPEMQDYFMEYTVVIFIVALALMLLLTVINFGFLFSKKSGDVFHALPLKRNELLFTRMLSSFIGAAFTMTLSYGSIFVVNLMPGIVPMELTTMVTVYIAMLLLLFMCTVFTTVFAVCSGGIFDFIIALGGINCGIPAVYYIFLNLLEHNAYGVSLDSIEAGICYTTPFAFSVLNVMELAGHGAKEIGKYFWVTHSQINFIAVIIFILFTALCIYGAAKLFFIRKSETAGEAYSFKIIPHIISVLVSIVGGYLLGYIFTGSGFDDFGFWLFFIIGVILASITAGAIFTRGFKTVRISMIRSAVAVGISLILCFTMLVSAGYIQEYIPKEESIEKITVGYEGETVFTDDFDIIIALHKAALGNFEDDNGDIVNYDEPTAERGSEYSTVIDQFDSIRIHYYLKNGRVVERQYNGLTEAEYDPYFLRYARSEAYLANFLDFEGTADTVEVTYNDWSVEDNKYIGDSYAMITPSQAKAILTAYTEELRSAPDSAFYEECDIISIWGIGSSSKSGIRIPQSFEKTRELISEIEFISEREEFNEVYYEK